MLDVDGFAANAQNGLLLTNRYEAWQAQLAQREIVVRRYCAKMAERIVKMERNGLKESSVGELALHAFDAAGPSYAVAVEEKKLKEEKMKAAAEARAQEEREKRKKMVEEQEEALKQKQQQEEALKQKQQQEEALKQKQREGGVVGEGKPVKVVKKEDMPVGDTKLSLVSQKKPKITSPGSIKIKLKAPLMSAGGGRETSSGAPNASAAVPVATENRKPIESPMQTVAEMSVSLRERQDATEQKPPAAPPGDNGKSKLYAMLDKEGL